MKGFTGDSRFYFGTELSDHLRILIEGATKIDVASAWITGSGALDQLVSRTQHGTAIRIVVGVGLLATDPFVLRRLGSIAKLELRVYGRVEPPLFHPKLYVFRHQHWQRVLIGSMNFTSSGTTKNIESVFSFEDKLRTSEREFERFWNSPLAIPFNQFDLTSYEARRHLVLTAVKGTRAADVLDVDVAATADNRVLVDELREGWKEYVAELQAVSETDMLNYQRVLAARTQLIDRDWSQDLNDVDLDLMFGVRPYMALGNLGPAKMNDSRFKGDENRVWRRQIGNALKLAGNLHGISRFEVEKIVQLLLDIPFCKAALATRLLVLKRPDFFVIVNKHSSVGLEKRFKLSLNPAELTARAYVDLLEKVHQERWFRSPEPEDLSEREFWIARTALLDSLVRDDHPNES